MLASNLDLNDFALDWNQPTDTVAQDIRVRERNPGVIDWVAGQPFYLHGVHEEDRLRGEPGHIVASRGDAICRATTDGGVWISHMTRVIRQPGDGDAFKLPATHVLRHHLRRLGVREAALPPDCLSDDRTYREIRYQERDGVGYLHFDYLNGAMSSRHCHELRAAFLHARRRPTRVIVLLGGTQWWSNGIHLNLIEDATDPAQASWDNINAINDLAREIIATESHLVVSALVGNAGAGGAMLALAADRVVAHRATVVHPYYRSMGGLHGSEYWTYLLPRRVGDAVARQLTTECVPVNAAHGLAIGLFDDVLGANGPELRAQVVDYAEALQRNPGLAQLLDSKRQRRAHDEALKPLESYRREELQHMWQNFYGADRSYHLARRRFVRKPAPSTATKAP
jgi:putative two-component system hydrogenase maturation factor HypX/HoxX